MDPSGLEVLAELDLAGPGKLIVSSIAHCGTLLVAIRFSPCRVHIFAGSRLNQVVHLPEDVSLLEFGCWNGHFDGISHQARRQLASTGFSSKLARSQLSPYLLIVTEACRAWVLRLSPGCGNAVEPHQGGSINQPELQPAKVPSHAQKDCGQHRVGTTGSSLVKHEEFQVEASDTASTACHQWAMPEQAAFLWMPAMSSASCHGAARLAAQLVWEFAQDLTEEAGAHIRHQQGSECSCFLDVSDLGKQHSKALAAPSNARESLLAVLSTGGTGSQPRKEVTCSLRILPSKAAKSSEASSAALHRSSSATVDADLMTALLRRGDASAGAHGCLLVGDEEGGVWACSLAGPARPPSGSRPTGFGSHTALQQPHPFVLLFDLQQPILDILPASSAQNEAPSYASSARSHDLLVIIARHGKVVQIGLKQSAQMSGGVQQMSAGPLGMHGPLDRPNGGCRIGDTARSGSEVELCQLLIAGPIASAAVADGVLYWSTGCSASAAVLPGLPQTRSDDSSHSEGQPPAAGSPRSNWHQLQPMPLPCGSHSPHTLTIASVVGCPALGSAADSMTASDSNNTGNKAARLVLLCTDGCLLSAPLLSADVVSKQKLALSGKQLHERVEVSVSHSGVLCLTSPFIVQICQKLQRTFVLIMQGHLNFISDLMKCKQLLDPHINAADAELAELALSVPLAQVWQLQHFGSVC